MAITRCPGYDLRLWKAADVFEVTCPQCGRAIEFWQDDDTRRCPKCKQVTTNPKLTSMPQQYPSKEVAEA